MLPTRKKRQKNNFILPYLVFPDPAQAANTFGITFYIKNILVA